MFKKALSLLLSLMLIITSVCVTAISVSAADDITYVVAGVQELCGAHWAGDTTAGADNIMTQNADGTYSMVYEDVAVMDDYQIKVVANDAAGNATWYGVNGGDNNVTFHVIDACDVTITFDPSTLAITVEGDGVEIPTGLEIEAMRTVGNGDGTWLNGVNWDPADDDNVMTEVASNVYEITYEDVEAFENYEVKFAANGSWAHNWGGVYTESGVESDAVYNGGNIALSVPYDLADVTIRLDLSNFDFASKTGAKFTITVVNAEEEEVETTVPETTEAETEATTEAETEATTEAPAADGLTVTATSNLFPSYTQKLSADEKQVTVTYTIDCEKDMLNTQWALTYDPEVLAFNRSANLVPSGRGYNFMPQVTANGVYNPNPDGVPGKILGNATDLGLYILSNNGPVTFVTVTFDIIGSGETTVDLFVDVLTVSLVGDDFQTDTTKEETICDYGTVKDYKCSLAIDSFVYGGTYTPNPTHPVAPETTVPATTVPETTVPETTVPETTVPETTEPVVGDATYLVAGSAAFCGAHWDATFVDNTMTKDGDVFVKVFSAAQPSEDEAYQIKVVETLADGTQNWIGDATGNNITFNVLTECDVTVTYNPATKEITVTGAGVQMVTDLAIDAIRTVGNGDGTWLNGVNWDPADDENKMTEITNKVYTITYEDVEYFENYEVKFAANGNWNDNWGGVFTESGVEADAVYNGGNIAVSVPYDLADVTLTLDLTNFNYADKTGAKFTITIVDATEEEETTVPETTVPETTVPETTVPETTVPATTEPVVGDATYLVAGSAAFCGAHWDATFVENTMTKDGDVFVKVFSAAQPSEGEAYQIKVVETLADGTQNWIGDATGNNITFNVLSECDVTVTYNPATKEITVTGAGVQMVTELEIDAIRTVGNGDGAWLNGVNWDPADDENKMTEITNKVYTITYEDVEYFENYEVKFAANGNWNDNWGGVFTESGVEADAVYNGNNIAVSVPYDLADVTLTLDLTNFNYADKTGAKFTITIVDATEEEETTVPETTVPETTVPANSLKVTSTSNFFGTDDIVVENVAGNKVIATYYLQSEKGLLNAQWKLSYDPALLQLVGTQGTQVISDGMIDFSTVGNVVGSCSNLDLYDFSEKATFVSVVFNVVGSGETVIDMNVTDLTVAELKNEASEETIVSNGNVVSMNGIDTSTELTSQTVAPETTVPETTVAPETTVPETTVAPETTEPETTEPETTEPETTEPETTEPETTEPETTVPETTVPETTEPTEAPSEDVTVAPTVPAETPDATSATGATTNGTSTSDTPSGGNNNGAVQTGNASMALVILLVLVSASAVLYFARKRVR